MTEQKQTYHGPWMEEPGYYDKCQRCAKKGDASYGTLLRRRVVGRDRDTYNEYKVQCKACGAETVVHTAKLVTVKEWEGRNEL